MRRLLPSLLLCVPAPALAGDLNPYAIAQDYARDEGEREDPAGLALWRPGSAPQRTPPPLAPPPTMDDVLEEARPSTRPTLGRVRGSLLRSLGFEGQTGLAARLRGLQSKLFLRLGAYDGDREDGFSVRQGHFEGLTEEDDRGRTMTLADGAVLADLSLSLGAVDSGVSVAQVAAGDASVVDLNPFRDVRAQFDLAFATLPRGLRKRLPPPLLVIRLSAAYLDAFTRAASAGDSASGIDSNSEVGLAAGIVW